MLFKILHIRKAVREARQDPGGFAGGEATEFVLGAFMLPIAILCLITALFFVLGFTGLLGGPMLLFKILFVPAFLVMLPTILFLRRILRMVKRATKRAVDAGVKEVKNELQ